MRSKLALILALAAFLALAAVGSAPAASPLGSVTESLLPGLSGNGSSETSSGAGTGSGPGGGGSTTTPSEPVVPGLPAASAVPQCADGIDNDGDGKIDLEDPDCSSPTDNTEGPETSAVAPTSGETLAPSTSTSGSGSTETGSENGAFGRGVYRASEEACI